MADEITETKKERYRLVVSIAGSGEVQIYKRYATSSEDAKKILTEFLEPFYNGTFSIVEIEKDKTHTV